jgi:PAS domain S-box-containing protein
MFNSLKIPFAFVVTGIFWAWVADPIITFLTKHLEPSMQDRYRSLNDFVFVIIIAFVLYFKIKSQQHKLTKSEEEYRHLFDSNPNPMWIYNDKSLLFVKVNNATIKKYGYSQHKFLRMTIYDIRPAEHHDKLRDYIEEHQDGIRMAGIWEHIKGNGETFSVTVISHPVLFKNENCTLVMATDITELLEKEKKLHDAYEKIKTSNEALLQIAWSNSHELRKPLCSIISLVALVKETTDEQERKEYLHLLEVSSTEWDQVLKRNNEKVNEIEIQEAI